MTARTFRNFPFCPTRLPPEQKEHCGYEDKVRQAELGEVFSSAETEEELCVCFNSLRGLCDEPPCTAATLVHGSLHKLFCRCLSPCTY
ncbi:unnamed protein product [Lota lota]